MYLGSSGALDRDRASRPLIERSYRRPRSGPRAPEPRRDSSICELLFCRLRQLLPGARTAHGRCRTRATKENAMMRVSTVLAKTTQLISGVAAMMAAAPGQAQMAPPAGEGRMAAQLTQAQTSQKPTIVLVHGAFAESASWEGVIRLLQAEGYPVIAWANPLRGVKSDSIYLANLIDTIKGPVVLVGHSFSGMLISNSATRKDNVTALMFVAALAPDAGETAN